MKKFKNKTELINFIEYQVSVKLVNDPNDRINKKRKVLHTEVSDQEAYRVFPLLHQWGIRYEKHLRNAYFIII